MTDLLNPDVKALLDAPLPAVISTQGGDGSIFSTAAWVDLEDDVLSVNTAVGRRWQVNLERDPHITLVVVNPENDQNLVEVRGTATGPSRDGADRPQPHLQQVHRHRLPLAGAR